MSATSEPDKVSGYIANCVREGPAKARLCITFLLTLTLPLPLTLTKARLCITFLLTLTLPLTLPLTLTKAGPAPPPRILAAVARSGAVAPGELGEL